MLDGIRRLDGMRRLDDRAAVWRAADFHPYARLTTGDHDGAGAVRGWRDDRVLAWAGPGPWGPVACALGDPARAGEVLAGAAAEGLIGDARWLHLPRATAGQLAAVARAAPATTLVHRDDWDFRWSHHPPPPQPGEEAATRLASADEPAVAALLERAFPGTTTRPGDPRVRGWYGIRDGGRLVAAGADRSRGGVGFLAGIAVDPAVRRRGLGAALTAAMTRRLFDTYDCVALGVMADERATARLYQRLGFDHALPRTSVSLAAA